MAKQTTTAEPTNSTPAAAQDRSSVCGVLIEAMEGFEQKLGEEQAYISGIGSEAGWLPEAVRATWETLGAGLAKFQHLLMLVRTGFLVPLDALSAMLEALATMLSSTGQGVTVTQIPGVPPQAMSQVGAFLEGGGERLSSPLAEVSQQGQRVLPDPAELQHLEEQLAHLLGKKWLVEVPEDSPLEEEGPLGQMLTAIGLVPTNNAAG